MTGLLSRRAGPNASGWGSLKLIYGRGTCRQTSASRHLIEVGSAWAESDRIHDIFHDSLSPLHVPRFRDKGWLHAIASARCLSRVLALLRGAMRDAGERGAKSAGLSEGGKKRA